MSKISTILFDFDGVITDTEPQYDIYMDELGKKYLDINNLASMVKGVTSQDTLSRHFGHLSPEIINTVKEDIEAFEKQMSFPPVPGAIEFIDYLKEKGYKIGLVTSSQKFKMKIALDDLKLTDAFDILITADNITEGKPNPMCYLLAAEGLGVNPDTCLVFEDSLFGIEAATNAGMRVVGLSTTVSPDVLQDKVYAVIPDFSDCERLVEIMGG